VRRILPKFGHSSYRADFGLPRLGVLIEVKYAHKGADFKKIENEVMIDSDAHLKNTDRCKEIDLVSWSVAASRGEVCGGRSAWQDPWPARTCGCGEARHCTAAPGTGAAAPDRFG